MSERTEELLEQINNKLTVTNKYLIYFFYVFCGALIGLGSRMW